MTKRWGEHLAHAGAIASVFVLWEIIARSGFIPHLLMPGLWPIAEAFWAALQNGDLFYHASFSLARAATGFALAVLAGIPLGAAMARLPLFETIFEPMFSLTYPVPKIALYPIFIFVFGLGSGSKIALVFLECLYPIAVNTYFGIKSVQPSLLRAAENMGASRFALFWKISLPAAAPDIFAGIRIALPIAFIIVILAEMIGESVGLGYYISYESVSFEYPTAMAAILAVAIIGFSLDRMLILLRRRLIYWERVGRDYE